MSVLGALLVAGVAVPLVAGTGAPGAVASTVFGIPEGTVLALGDAPPLATPAPDGVVGLAATPSGRGWWAVSSDGAVVAAGDAAPLGDVTGILRRRPVVGMAATRTGGGYWLAGSDGGIFSFGDAPFHGSAGGLPLVAPVVGMAATPSGGGYWMVAADGGIFSYGDAHFHGSMGGVRLQSPVVGMTPLPGGGYLLVAADGGIFSFGAGFHGPGEPGARTIAATASGEGYWIGLDDGRLLARGDAVPYSIIAPLAGSVGALARSAGGQGLLLAVGPTRETIEVSEPGGLSPGVDALLGAAAVRAGAGMTVWHGGTIDLLTIHRGHPLVWEAPPGWRVPATALAVDPGPSRSLVGARVADALAAGEVALGAASARLHGATVGDTVFLLGWDGRTHGRRVGAIADDTRTGSAEVVLAVADAASMGFSRPLTVVLFGGSRGALEAAAGAVGGGLDVDRSWEPPSLDDVLPLVRIKELLGEMAYLPGRGDSVTMHPGFTAGITTERVPLLGRVTCHVAVLPALRGALDDVARAGLGGALGRYGGCFTPRLIRGGDSGGSLSRHSFGIAVDLNITNNSFGGRVSMDPAVVDIFRRWGFAWGGTWTRPDGMHFEWVGGR